MPMRQRGIPLRQQRRVAVSLMALAAMMSCTELAAPNDALSALNAELAKGPVIYALAQVGE